MACKCCRYYMWKLVHQIKALTIKWHWCVGEAFNCETIDWSKMNFWHNVSFKINQISNTLLSIFDIITRNRKINIYFCLDDISILFTNNFTAITYYHMMLVIIAMLKSPFYCFTHKSCSGFYNLWGMSYLTRQISRSLQ